MDIYIVQPQDTVDKIASAFQIPVSTIIFNNQLIPPYALAVGQTLLIGEAPSPGEKRQLISFGYAYPYISPWVLEQTLPFLTDLYVFSYGFTMEGNLLAPPVDDRWMVERAAYHAVRPILTLTPFGPDGRFNNALIHSVVQNPVYKETLISQLLAVLQELGYQGVDVDFEYILPEDRDAFTEFFRDLTNALHQYGYHSSVALAPKTSADQPGLLYEGKDYGALGAIADSVLLMTYEWGYKYGPNMAVAPLNMVRQVVEYAVSEIPPEKINLGIPNYGYDWPLPFVQGTTVATTIGNVEAVQIAIREGVPIQFDDEAQSPFFRYQRMGVDHEVWFEDLLSIQAKFALIEEYGLLGAGYWQLMRWWRANWLLMADTFRIV